MITENENLIILGSRGVFLRTRDMKFFVLMLKHKEFIMLKQKSGLVGGFWKGNKIKFFNIFSKFYKDKKTKTYQGYSYETKY